MGSSKRITKYMIICSILLVTANSCGITTQTRFDLTERTAVPMASRQIEQSNAPTPPSTLPDLIKVLANSKNAEARIGAAHVLELMGPQAAPAVNALISNISYRESYEVREAAVRALGAIGKEAKPSVHQLTIALETDFVVVRRAVAEVLGQIDDKSAVPALAKALYGDDDGVNAFAARSIALLTNQKFPDMEGAGFFVDKDGIPFIVKAAKNWWEREGQYQDWTNAK